MGRATNGEPVHIGIRSIIRAKPFRRGVDDYHAGVWSEIEGAWRDLEAGDIYEQGRLVAAFTGKRLVGPLDYLRAVHGGAIPLSQP